MKKLLKTGARFSMDRKHRFLLYRIWDSSKGLICFIGLNPSIANGEDNDNTITRLMHFTVQEGFGGFYIVNLFSQIATDFDDLRANFIQTKSKDNYFIWKFSMKSEKICLMYGDKGIFENRNLEVLKLLDTLNLTKKLYCFRRSKKNNPVHPLYLPNVTRMIRYETQKKSKA